MSKLIENLYNKRDKKPVHLCKSYQHNFCIFCFNSHKIPKFSDARKLCCNLPKIQTKSPHLTEFSQEHANGIANSEDPDQTAPLGAV